MFNPDTQKINPERETKKLKEEEFIEELMLLNFSELKGNLSSK